LSVSSSPRFHRSFQFAFPIEVDRDSIERLLTILNPTEEHFECSVSATGRLTLESCTGFQDALQTVPGIVQALEISAQTGAGPTVSINLRNDTTTVATDIVGEIGAVTTLADQLSTFCRGLRSSNWSPEQPQVATAIMSVLGVLLAVTAFYGAIFPLALLLSYLKPHLSEGARTILMHAGVNVVPVAAALAALWGGSRLWAAWLPRAVFAVNAEGVRAANRARQRRTLVISILGTLALGVVSNLIYGWLVAGPASAVEGIAPVSTISGDSPGR
jgi:hypothetical protein